MGHVGVKESLLAAFAQTGFLLAGCTYQVPTGLPYVEGK